MKHPATALLSFVENVDTLDDERYMAEAVEASPAWLKSLK
jgi:hypothetical protein